MIYQSAMLKRNRFYCQITAAAPINACNNKNPTLMIDKGLISLI